MRVVEGNGSGHGERKREQGDPGCGIVGGMHGYYGGVFDLEDKG